VPVPKEKGPPNHPSQKLLHVWSTIPKRWTNSSPEPVTTLPVSDTLKIDHGSPPGRLPDSAFRKGNKNPRLFSGQTVEPELLDSAGRAGEMGIMLKKFFFSSTFCSS